MFDVMQRNLLILALAFTTTGCITQSGIQGKYVAQQNECRSEAARFVSGLSTTTDAGDAQSAAGTHFSECMNKAGWRVAVPKPTQVASGPAPNPPTGSPSTNPSAAISSAPAPVAGGVSPSEGTATIYRGQHAPTGTGTDSAAASAATSGRSVPVENAQPVVGRAPQPAPATAAAQYNPPSGAPSVKPSAAATRAAQPEAAPSTPVAPARYTPARPTAVTSAPYGQGAGRQF
jgi:hypothetical protein